MRLINGQSPPALLAAVRQDLAAIRRAHPGAKPMLALPFFNGWMIGGIHECSLVSVISNQLSEIRNLFSRCSMNWQLTHVFAVLSSSRSILLELAWGLMVFTRFTLGGQAHTKTDRGL